jgi:outer membrane receptor protein involved in Fe transport
MLVSQATLVAQNTSGESQEPVTTQVDVTVIGLLPLPGVEVPASQVPAPVQTATDRDITLSGAVDLSDFLNRNLNGVHINEIQNNPFQPDVNYRGYAASPLLGTPQGLSVYMDGVRLNQPFGEVVNWDLIPRIAIASTTLMPGSNPMFGLNTLGGALSVQTKDGRGFKGTTIQANAGDYLRRSVEFEHGGQAASKRFDWYVAGTLFAEDGWRDESPSDVRQIFGKAAWHRERSDVTLSLGHATNSLNGNGLQEFRLLGNDYSSIYTKPDTTKNRSTMANATWQRRWSNAVTMQANGYYRDLRASTLNGDINEGSLDQSVYQPSAAEIAALTAAGYTGFPLSGANASNTPFPSWRCVANILRNDEPGEKCNGLINRTHATQKNGGLSGQVTHRRSVGPAVNLFTVGAAFDSSAVRFGQSSQLGYLNADRSVTGLNAFADGGVTGGDVDGVPLDSRVDLDGTIRTVSLYVTDTLPVGTRTHVTLSGRFNRTSIQNRDHINPGGGDESLDGDHVYSRFNPAAGITVDLTSHLNLYAGYSGGSRAATAIELGCANPEQPCRLPNAMAGDPPLEQVVTRTVEAGLRGTRGVLAWHAGVFFAQNANDIQFVASDQTGFGYFTNFGKTRRQGAEVGARTRVGRVTVGAEYTFLRATFQSAETFNGESNSANEEAEAGRPGLEGTITVEPGSRMPLIPQHMAKVFGDLQLTPRLSVHANLIGVGSSYGRGNENNEHDADGVYYFGEGTVDGYAVINLGVRVNVTRRVDVIGQLNNVFNTEYSTASQLGPTGITPGGAYIARPFPAVNGEFPLYRSTFVAPGAPFRAWGGIRVRF